MNPHNSADTAEMPVTMPTSQRDIPPNPSGLVQADVAGLTDQGKVRPNNEDHFLFVRFGRYLEVMQTSLPAEQIPPRAQETGYGMVVADGIGGHQGGEDASRLAVSFLVQMVLSTPDWILQVDDDRYYEEVLKRAANRLRRLNETLAQHARDEPGLRGFGTTMTLAASLGPDLMLAHVGDSRAYVLRAGELHQLTCDHTLAQELANRGIIAQPEVATHHLRNVLTQALGVDERDVKPEVHKLHLKHGDCLLLCTDGLTDMVPNAAIAQILGTAETAATACQLLIQDALDAGGKDNVTVIVARYRFLADE